MFTYCTERRHMRIVSVGQVRGFVPSICQMKLSYLLSDNEYENLSTIAVINLSFAVLSVDHDMAFRMPYPPGQKRWYKHAVRSDRGPS